MYKRFLTGIFVFLFILNNSAQQTPVKLDFKKMETEIKDKNSPFYYPALTTRYTSNDTMLTVEEYRYLYYGFSLQDKYSPYGRSALNDELKKCYKNKDTVKIIELEKRVLKEYPFNLGDLYEININLEKNGQAEEARLYYKKMIGVAKAILSTGDGHTDSTAMYVISVDHEYDMIGLMGYRFGNSQSLLQNKGHSMDQMKLEKNEENIEYLYFNVDRLFDKMKDMFKK